MNVLALGVSITGVLSAVFTSLINIFLLKNFFNANRKKEDMMLFFYRFSVDVFMGLLTALFLVFTTLFSLDMRMFAGFQKFIFFFGLPSSNFVAVRLILSLAINLERNMAVYVPIYFRNFRQHIPTLSILLFSLSVGIFQNVVLFLFCNYSFNMPDSCPALGCAVNTCFLSFWTSEKSTLYALTFLFSVTLGVKLLVSSKSGRNSNSARSRANRLALLDAGIVLFFNFLPSFIGNQYSNTEFFSFQHIGPYAATAEFLGSGIEGYLVFKSLARFRSRNLKTLPVDVHRSRIQKSQIQSSQF